MVAVTDITFSNAFEEIVEDKMIAEQEKLKAEYEKEKAIIQAEQELEVSKKQAEAELVKAEAEARAIEEIAKAQANSIKLKSIETARMLGFTITETINENEIIYDIDFEGKTQEEINAISNYLKYIEYLEVWNGELPTVMTDNGATIMIPVP
jgi:regulator of protease activity HflC (stomatin/prohibitin superfamily)